jgi:hypothetical protein
MDEPEDSPGYATSETSSKLLAQWTNQKIPQAMPYIRAYGAMDEPEDSPGYATSETNSKSLWCSGRTRIYIRNQFQKLLAQWTNQKTPGSNPGKV